MNKKIICVAGLPASGKDTVAQIFEDNNYYLMSYSKDILKPIIENPKEKIEFFTKETIGILPTEEIEKIANKIIKFKSTQKGRELYINVAQYLNKVCSVFTNKKYNHFTLFATSFYKNKDKIIIAGFRQKPELEILQTKYPNAIIKIVYVKSNDETRYSRLKIRDKIDEKTIFENEKFELETTHKLMIEEIKFNYIIENNSTLEELKEKTSQLIEEINNL